MPNSNKKHDQLGMNPSTASGRLVKDVLFDLVVRTGSDSCFQCGEKVTRENFSIEHKTAWLDSDDPVGLYFSLDNIAYSHLKCNFAAARKPGKSAIPVRVRNAARMKADWQALTKEQQQERRRAKYLKHGK